MWFQAPQHHSPQAAEPTRTLASESDADLLRRIGQSDHAAYSELVKRHLDRLLAFVERTMGSRTEAEDIVQESFLRVWQHASRWNERGVQFSTWLHQVALNLCRDRWRRNTGDNVELDPTILDQQPGPETRTLQAAQSGRVQAALQALPKRQRVAIVLTHYQGLSNPEAATVLECSVEAVESLLSRARRQLRQQLIGEQSNLQEP